MKTIISLLLFFISNVSTAQVTCFPPPVSDCGKGAVRGVTGGVEWSAWWAERAFDWVPVHWYRAPGAAVTLPAPGAASTAQDFAQALWRLNAGEGLRRCGTSAASSASIRAACEAMRSAVEATKPAPILYNVDRATSTDGTRPGYRLISSTGALVADGSRHKAGAWCECWRGAVKPGASQYCLVTQTQSYSVCKRTQ